MKRVFAVLGVIALVGCSSASMARLNVALNEFNGGTWPDQSRTNALSCGSGTGNLVEYSGVNGGSGYVYYYNQSSQTATIHMDYEDGDAYEFTVAPGAYSTSIYNHPGYAWNVKWWC